MRNDRQQRQQAHRQAAISAREEWRNAADGVQTAWDDVLRAPRGARSGAYAMYMQALRREDDAACELRARTAVVPTAGVDPPPIAA